MLKKKRYKKNTLGRLGLFFQKKMYSGLIRFASTSPFTEVTYLEETISTQLKHYILVTKKKICYTNN